MEKTLTIKMSEKEHKEIKVLSAEEGKTIKDFVLDLIKMYIQEKDKIEIENVSYEELSEEEKKIIDKGREERLKGEFIDVDTFLRETEE